MKLSIVFAIPFALAACATHDELSQLAQHSDVVTAGGPSPESDECGYRRSLLGTSDGLELWGPPALYQNNCHDGYVCGNPTLGDTCTPTDSELITCGCVPASTTCDPAKLAADLDSGVFLVREAATARATQCCLQASTSIADRDKFLDGLRGTSPSAELASRIDKVIAGCPGAYCTGKWEWVEPFNPNLTDVGTTLQCILVENHCLDYKPTTSPAYGGSDQPCTCSCAPYPGPLPVTEKQ